MQTALCVAYFAVLLFLATYGLHRSHLVLTVLRHRKKLEATNKAFDARAAAERESNTRVWPRVTVQLPLFNEATVVDRLLEHTAKIDYPRNRLEIQVLDDSTDETQALARKKVQELAVTGLDIVYLHRTDRTGYKAGALDAGLKVAKGEFVAVFDADFLPLPGFLKDVVPDFDDPKVGMVQARWGHMNREHSLLTRVQALMLDGHHLVENRARSAAGWLFNFSGTGGMWRKEVIGATGGWQHDTLTEDLDLSYRAQLAGWRFVYRDRVVTPAELPEDVSAFRAQQYRWAKGTVQTSRKLMKRVMTSKDLSFSQKLEAYFHLTPHFAYPLMVLLSVLLLPALILMPATNPMTMLIVDLPLCIGTTGSLAVFYMMAETAQGRRRRDALKVLPALLALGAGLAPHLSRAVFDGAQHMAGEFVRTPKRGVNLGRYHARADIPFTEIFLALISTVSVVASIETGHWFATPFAGLFAFGYSYVATLVVREQLVRTKSSDVSSPVSERDSGEVPAVAVSEQGDIAAA